MRCFSLSSNGNVTKNLVYDTFFVSLQLHTSNMFLGISPTNTGALKITSG